MPEVDASGWTRCRDALKMKGVHSTRRFSSEATTSPNLSVICSRSFVEAMMKVMRELRELIEREERCDSRVTVILP